MAAITRKQFRDAVEVLLEAQRTATPTLLRKTARFQTSLSGEKPIAWQGEITSALTYDQGTRRHVMTEDAQLVTTFPADSPTDDFDDLMDALLDRFTAAYNAVGSGTTLELLSITPNEVAVAGSSGDLVFRGAVLGLRLRILEGRI